MTRSAHQACGPCLCCVTHTSRSPSIMCLPPYPHRRMWTSCRASLAATRSRSARTWAATGESLAVCLLSFPGLRWQPAQRGPMAHGHCAGESSWQLTVARLCSYSSRNSLRWDAASICSLLCLLGPLWLLFVQFRGSEAHRRGITPSLLRLSLTNLTLLCHLFVLLNPPPSPVAGTSLRSRQWSTASSTRSCSPTTLWW